MYDIASLTKVVATWPLIGQALGAGLLDLDAPIRDFLPPVNSETPSGEASVRQLIAHTSGLRTSTRLDHYRGSDPPLHELLCREALEDTPGRHRYINRGYILCSARPGRAGSWRARAGCALRRWSRLRPPYRRGFPAEAGSR
ncbi:hypothetical protein GCM10010236_09810 [Streptomyces eurythermus]|nr:hypothetical protein GCM10010236_09810 [Streptomyces eurythermus]